MEKSHNHITISRDFGKDIGIQRVENLGKMHQQPFRASQMLKYEWRPGHAIAANDSNLDAPEDDKNILVPDPVEQQHIVQDTNPFTILANDEERENDDDEEKQVLPDNIKHQGAEDAININQNYFKLNQEYQGDPQKTQGAQKDHKNRG